ncbi:MAG: hypothetical protein WCX88_04370, partial [Patescibacteria group bacterium]
MEKSKHSLDFLPGSEALFENHSQAPQTASPNQKQKQHKRYPNPKKRPNPQAKISLPMDKPASSNKLRIIPIGGNEEVGRNMTIFEYGKDIIVLDMGLQFPEEDTPGIDFIIPNTKYLEENKKNIRA